MPRVNFLEQQIQIWRKNKAGIKPSELVQNFRLHYPNKASFSTCISRYKGKLRKLGAHESFLSELKPTPEEIAYVKKQGKTRLEDRCRNAVTLKNCGDNLIIYFRQCLESSELGKIYMGIAACTGLRMMEIVRNAVLEVPKLTHDTDDVYWAYSSGICKKAPSFEGHERPLLHRRDIVTSALKRLRNMSFFAAFQKCDLDNAKLSDKVCKKINRSVASAWPYPDVKKVTSHFFRIFYVASTFHYFNKTSSLLQWCSTVLGHESMECSFAYTGMLITGFGSFTFDAERQLHGLARLIKAIDIVKCSTPPPRMLHPPQCPTPLQCSTPRTGHTWRGGGRFG